MVVTIGGDEEKATEQRVLAALDALQQPLDRATFEAAREAFLYHVASDTQTPQERADNLGWYTVEGNLQYAPGLANGSYEQAVRDARSAIRCRCCAPLSAQSGRRELDCHIVG